MADIFISYARADNDWAEKICHQLSGAGFNIVNSESILSNFKTDKLSHEIVQVVVEAHAVVVLWSSASVNSVSVKLEAALAFEMGKLVPIQIEACELPSAFSVLQTEILYGSEEVYTASFDRFVERVAQVADPQGPQQERRSRRTARDISAPNAFRWRALALKEPPSRVQAYRLDEMEQIEALLHLRPVTQSGYSSRANQRESEISKSGSRAAGLIVVALFLLALAGGAVTYFLSLRYKLIEPPSLDWLPSWGLFFWPFGAKRRGDNVEVSVFAPQCAQSGSAINIQVFVHSPDYQYVASLATRIDPSAVERSRKPLREKLTRGDEVTFVLSSNNPETQKAFELEAPRIDSMVWQGRSGSISFVCDLRTDARPRNHALRLTVLRSGQPLGELQFTIETVQAQDSRAPNQPSSRSLIWTPTPSDNAASQVSPSTDELAPVEARTYRQIFVSYARADLTEVRKVVRGWSATGQKFFMDTQDLRSGTNWEAELVNQIECSDVVVLFWSENARNSKMVRTEIEYALKVEAQRGKPNLFPFPLDGPPPAEPWDFLAHRHIGDPIYYGFASRN